MTTRQASPSCRVREVFAIDPATPSVTTLACERVAKVDRLYSSTRHFCTWRHTLSQKRPDAGKPPTLPRIVRPCRDQAVRGASTMSAVHVLSVMPFVRDPSSSRVPAELGSDTASVECRPIVPRKYCQLYPTLGWCPSRAPVPTCLQAHHCSLPLGSPPDRCIKL